MLSVTFAVKVSTFWPLTVCILDFQFPHSKDRKMFLISMQIMPLVNYFPTENPAAV